MHSLSAAFLTAVHFSTMPQKPALLIRISHHFADAAASNPRKPLLCEAIRLPGNSALQSPFMYIHRAAPALVPRRSPNRDGAQSE
jgi:hypothetical protein